MQEQLELLQRQIEELKAMVFDTERAHLAKVQGLAKAVGRISAELDLPINEVTDVSIENIIDKIKELKS